MNPERYADSYTEIFLMVWFEELDEPVDFLASPFDCERHGKELWIRAMAGEFGSITVLPEEQSPMRIFKQQLQLEQQLPKMLTHDSLKDIDI